MPPPDPSPLPSPRTAVMSSSEIRRAIDAATPATIRHPAPRTLSGDLTPPGWLGADLPLSERYDLLTEVARGGTGVVYHGWDRLLARDVAVKALRPELAASATAEQRLLREGRAGGRLTHPGLVPVYDAGRLPDGRAFLAFEFLVGRTLTAALAGPTVHRPGLVSAVRAAAEAVAFAHAAGVVHRDLTPHNLYLPDRGGVKVLDWGLARIGPDRGSGLLEIWEPDPLPTARPAGPLTAPGRAVGTPGYAAPELARGEHERAGEPADVFGLGAVLCEVLTGYPPFAHPDPGEVVRRNLAGEVDDARVWLTRVGGRAARLAAACLDPDPSARPSAGEVADRLARRGWLTRAIGR